MWIGHPDSGSTEQLNTKLVSSIDAASRPRLLTVRANTRIMTRDVTSCRATDGLPDVLSMMQAWSVVHVPVIDALGIPIDVVNARDALRELMVEGQYKEALQRDYVMGVGYQ